MRGIKNLYVACVATVSFSRWSDRECGQAIERALGFVPLACFLETPSTQANSGVIKEVEHTLPTLPTLQ